MEVKMIRCSFETAMKYMRLGYKVRRTGWEGYWYLDEDLMTIWIAYKWWKGEKVEKELKHIMLCETEDMYATLLHTTEFDWEVLEREEK